MFHDVSRGHWLYWLGSNGESTAMDHVGSWVALPQRAPNSWRWAFWVPRTVWAKSAAGCERWKDMVFKILNLMLCNLELDHTRSRCFYNDDYNTLIPHSYPPGHGSWYFLIRKIEAFSPWAPSSPAPWHLLESGQTLSNGFRIVIRPATRLATLQYSGLQRVDPKEWRKIDPEYASFIN